jgi:hypothetical protein
MGDEQMDETALYEVCMILGCKNQIVPLSEVLNTDKGIAQIGFATVIEDSELHAIFKYCKGNQLFLTEDLLPGLKQRRYYPEALYIYCFINSLDLDRTEFINDEQKTKGAEIYKEILRRIGRCS